MKTLTKPDLELKPLIESQSNISLREKEINNPDYRFYQKLFVVLISFSTILIFPESPRELENICNKYSPSKLCNVW